MIKVKRLLKFSAVVILLLSADTAMAETNADIGSEARIYAERGQGFDSDGVYGMQCVDLPNAFASAKNGYMLYGNAIDLLDSAKAHGLLVRYAGQGYHPKKGAIFVKAEPTHPYGHTGIVTSDKPDANGVVEVAQQNAGADSNLTYGTPASLGQYHESDFIGWFYLEDK